MQYCTKCKNICEDKLTVCPHCNRTKGLRAARDGDSVFLQKTTEFEASEFARIFEEQAIKFEIVPYSTGLVSSLYDSEVMPTDKNVFVNFEDLDRAKKTLEKEYMEDEPQEEEFDEVPRKKRIVIQIISTIAFLVVVCLVVFSADAVANGIKDLFSSLF